MKRHLFRILFIFLASGLFAETITLFSEGLKNRKSYSISSADVEASQVYKKGNIIFINSTGFTVYMRHQITDSNKNDWFNLHLKQGDSPGDLHEEEKFKKHPKKIKTIVRVTL